MSSSDKIRELNQEIDDHEKEKAELVPFNQCIRVQTDFFIDNGKELIRVNKTVIEDDYGKGRSKEVKKYFRFINEPSHINYQKTINRYFNLYRPLPHTPQKGEWDNLNKIISHIFRGDDYKKIITFFWVIYSQPKHPLPVIGLTGGKGTGKTKFLELVKRIFGVNAKVIEPEDLTAKFNSSFMDKIAILIDEKTAGKNKYILLQKLKKLSTGGSQTKKAKFLDDVDIPFYGKFFMASNDLLDMITLEEENTRFWILDVEPFKEGTTDLDVLEKAEKEIPHFLYFLEHEFTPIERQSRTWLSEDTYQTKRSMEMQENSQSRAKKEIKTILQSFFEEYPDKEEIYFTSEHFYEAFGGKVLDSRNYIETVLKKDFDKSSKLQRKDNPFLAMGSNKRNPDLNSALSNTIKQRRFYHFYKDEIVKHIEIVDEKYFDTDGKELTKEENDKRMEEIHGSDQNENAQEDDDSEIPF